MLHLPPGCCHGLCQTPGLAPGCCDKLCQAVSQPLATSPNQGLPKPPGLAPETCLPCAGAWQAAHPELSCLQASEAVRWRLPGCLAPC